MKAPVTASERDLVALAGIIGEDRPDLPADGGLPESLLADLMGQIRCDRAILIGFDSGRKADWFAQLVPLQQRQGHSRREVRWAQTEYTRRPHFGWFDTGW